MQELRSSSALWKTTVALQNCLHEKKDNWKSKNLQQEHCRARDSDRAVAAETGRDRGPRVPPEAIRTCL